MPAVKFLLHRDLEEKISFLDGHYLAVLELLSPEACTSENKKMYLSSYINMLWSVHWSRHALL